MTTATSIAQLAGLVAAAQDGDRRLVVGIAGAPGAGKSTIAEQLVALVPRSALLGMDGYHLPQARLGELGRRQRMGAADTFDTDAFVRSLTAIAADDGPVIAPGFDREIEEPVAAAITISPEARVVLVEGNYLLHDSGGWQAVAALIDLAFFIELDHNIRLERLVARHIRFGKTPDEAEAWANGPDEANARLIAAGASRADHIVRLG